MTPPLKPSARRVLAALQASGSTGATTHELGQANIGGFRFGARIHELRAAGYRIVERRERTGSSRYTLIDPEQLAGAA
jgi:hypothetical protein